MFRFSLCVALLAAAALSAAADEAVEIKPPASKAGARYKVTKTEKTTTTETSDGGGKKASKDREETKRIVYAEEVVTPGAPGEKDTKVVRVYEAYEQKGDRPGPVPPLNTPVAIAKAGGKYEFTADKPLGEFAKRLEDEFNKPDRPSTKDYLPGKPVKPGDTWTIDPAKFARSLGSAAWTVDAAKSKMSGKLVKTHTKDGKRFGVLEIAAEFPLKDLGPGAPPLKSGALRVTATLDVCIDGTDAAESTRSALGLEVVVDAKGTTVTVKSEGVLTTTREPLPKK